MNKVMLLGNLTRDVEVKMVGENKVAKFGMANNRKFKDKEDTTFMDCECWGKRADVLEKYFHKGTRILVEGELRQDNWEDKTTGEKKSRYKIAVTDFWFQDSKKNSEEENEGGNQEKPKATPTPMSTKKEKAAASGKNFQPPVDNPPF